MNNDLIKTAAFLQKNLGSIKRMGHGRRSREKLLCWLSWHVGRGTICVIKENDQIKGVGIARPLLNASESIEAYQYNERGTHVHVEQVVAKTHSAFIELLNYVSGRFPQAKTISFYRQKSGSIQKVYSFERFMKKALN